MHSLWCGSPCSECEKPCIYDERTPCSLDCKALRPDGTRDVEMCKEAGCDAVMDIYTHDEAMLIVEMFEDILSKYNIHVPSPEDDERDADNMVGLYGSTYSDLLDAVENSLIDLLQRHQSGANVVQGEFSGRK